ncbi:hypothetical protein Lal_00013416 [Lupinus albus]|uniref:Uncharacterized protein n=1 Tax=Lupinus albus TaxID=3870 RepID=A0A6A5LUR4_LUPAL|nr:putative protein kinase RLK-Pelle-CrRLK1L-1 family [Lupinus albus]KAF1862655.1 hypothetical protein Lal_00013416 [Lupinus albus]
MATLLCNKIQHFHFTLIFLIQLSLLQFISSSYTIPNKYFINCGSNNNVTEPETNHVFVAESYSEASFSSRSKIYTNQSFVPSPLYKTARIFTQTHSWYGFNIETTGTYMLRLHFLAFASSTSNLSSAKFNVSVPNFWLLRNFDARNYTNMALVKEFLLHIPIGNFKITFTPLLQSFAFVNAIEFFILPLHFISDNVAIFSYGTNRGLTTYPSTTMQAQMLETIHRINVGGENVTRGIDNLWRNWLSDDGYLLNRENAKNSTPYNSSIKYHVGDDSKGPYSNKFIAPNAVYQTAKQIISNSSNLNITWSFPVDKDTDHFIRLHFCDIWSSNIGLAYFSLYIYDNYVIEINKNIDGDVLAPLHSPYYYDYVVHSDNSGVMKISVGPDKTAKEISAFLNGVEIMKLSNSSDSVPLDGEHKHKYNHLAVVIGAVLGGFVLVCVVVVGFLWRLKTRKQKAVENSDWLPIHVTALGSSHCRLTEGSPHPNINLGLKISLIDIQFATNNFDAKEIIGKGGFGNVYKGVLKNGMKVAAKRSEPGSGQGLPEFQTEIMVLSKIRHRHLVSLIGYCDERNEMILVYEYMEKGTVRDHLYNTNSPTLSWMQRLEICIGAARGLHYLHKGASGGIIHRDVKSSNILLDENYVAKVADFGLSKTGPLDDNQSYISTGVKGTFGYLDPEYFMSQQLTEKSDVYSFGVVLLEVLCARSAIDPLLPRDQANLAEWGILCKNKGILEDIIDPSINGQINPNSLRKFSETFEKCLQEDGCDRPTMSDVLWDLEYVLQLQRGAVHREPHEDSSSSTSASLLLHNARLLPSLSALSEVDDMSIVKADESDSAAD